MSDIPISNICLFVTEYSLSAIDSTIAFGYKEHKLDAIFC